MDASLAGRLLEWMFTYLLHSSFLLLVTGFVTYAWLRDEAWRETLWRAALLGSVVTATLVTLGPVTPLTGRLSFVAGVSVPGPGEAAAPGWPASTGGTSVPAPGEPAAYPPGDRGAAVQVWGGASLLALWAGGSGVLLVLLARRNLLLFARLRDRERIAAGPLVERLAELRRWAGVWRPVRLSVSPVCATPLVLGSSEICLPPRFVEELDAEEQTAALAHEMAHVRRRDPHWRLGLGILNALLFFQPLNVLARRRLVDSAEYLCDDWAVRQADSGVALGRCLARIASWTAPGPQLPLRATPAIAEGGSPLVRRIRRIAEGTSPGVEERMRPALTAAVALLVATSVVPAVEGDDGAQEAVPTSSEAALLEDLALRDADPRVRQEAAAALSDVGDRAAEDALMRLALEAPDPVVRAEAAQQLDEFPTDRAVAVLLDVVLADSVPDVRETALFTIEDFSLPSSREALRRLAREHPDPEMRTMALAALTDGESALPTR